MCSHRLASGVPRLVLQFIQVAKRMISQGTISSGFEQASQLLSSTLCAHFLGTK
jgi:hypothetical protein